MLPKIYPVTCHTDHVGQGSTFVAIKGYKSDGVAYVQKAIDLGATKIVIEDGVLLPSNFLKNNIEIISVKNTRKALAEFSARSLDNPASKLKIIGITGTKGKTTTTYLIEHILRQAGFKTALVGTVKNKILDQELETSNTTPEGDYLQMFFAQCVKNGVDFVIMEVSSHALSLHRVYGVNFDVVGFTNLAPEHLDFYSNMDEYFQAKMEIFKQIKVGGSCIINTDNDWGKRALEILSENDKCCQNCVIKFGQKEFGSSNFFKISISENSLDGLKFKLGKPICQVESSRLFGEFNVYNLTMSYLVCRQLGISELAIKQAIRTFSGVPGRLQLHILKNGAKAFVDYAHNPSSMEAVLQTLRPLTKDLIVVFGCGGDRDKTKRPVMGKIACENADSVVITSDNPRTEEPQEILKNILAGIDSQEMQKVTCELDRRKAIQKAVELAGYDSVIALLGKGHEDYFLINGQKFHLDDLEEISKY